MDQIVSITVDQFITMILAIVGAGGAGTFLAVKVALAQIIKSIAHAQETGNSAHKRLDNYFLSKAGK